jgi:hypothetical protein
MSRIKFPALLIVLAMTLLWPLPVAAQDPDPNTCLPSCYAYNGASPGGNGTENYPWLWDKANDPDASDLRQKMRAAVENKRNLGTLLVIDCEGSPLACTAISYTYARNGNETSQDVGPVPVPPGGVSLPFPYVLAGVALLAIVLIIAGFILRRRIRHLGS